MLEKAQWKYTLMSYKRQVRLSAWHVQLTLLWSLEINPLKKHILFHLLILMDKRTLSALSMNLVRSANQTERKRLLWPLSFLPQHTKSQ